VQPHAVGIYNRMAKLKPQFPAVEVYALEQLSSFKAPAWEGDRA